MFLRHPRPSSRPQFGPPATPPQRFQELISRFDSVPVVLDVLRSASRSLKSSWSIRADFGVRRFLDSTPALGGEISAKNCRPRSSTATSTLPFALFISRSPLRCFRQDGCTELPVGENLVTSGRLSPTRGTFRRNFTTNHTLKDVQYVRFRRPGEQPGPQGWDPRFKMVALFGGLGTVYYVSHLEQVPQTGRWRFMNTSQKTEAEIGEMSRKQLYHEYGAHILPPTHPVSRHVRRVVTRILSASNLGVIRGEKPESAVLGLFDNFGGAYGPEKQWDVLVVNDRKMINAMATPGVVVVFTGILPVCQDEEGLAAVLAHEIGHVVARHTAERISSQFIWIGLGLVLQILGLDAFLSHSLTTYALELPNSRTQEKEADLIGLRLMSRACYNPGAAPAMFERLGKVEKSIMSRRSFEFAQTHPASENRVKVGTLPQIASSNLNQPRVQYLEAALPEAYRIVEDNPECAQVRRQLDAFRETAHGIKVTDIGSML
ncbi:hypothetical protein NMY22_g6483 [Coprinellus aureogranulatus]|nr:hypothetical protein NMY22_g6483 [Coprinellus aureogranulatus]